MALNDVMKTVGIVVAIEALLFNQTLHLNKIWVVNRSVFNKSWVVNRSVFNKSWVVNRSVFNKSRVVIK